VAGTGIGRQEQGEQTLGLVAAQAQGRGQGGQLLLLGHRQVDGVFQFLTQRADFRAHLGQEPTSSGFCRSPGQKSNVNDLYGYSQKPSVRT
jgi:hypothetical protein